LQVDGFVGILDKDGNVNKATAALVKLASPYPCTFHRAFDVVKNIDESLEAIIECGFTTILD
jgi:copper homeostasis protein